jgi:hypothetical protein
MAVHLGDILDGKQPRATAPQALQRVQQCFETFEAARQQDQNDDEHLRGRVLHVVGNHCLYNLERENLIKTLGMTNEAPVDEEVCGSGAVE